MYFRITLPALQDGKKDEAISFVKEKVMPGFDDTPGLLTMMAATTGETSGINLAAYESKAAAEAVEEAALAVVTALEALVDAVLAVVVAELAVVTALSARLPVSTTFAGSEVFDLDNAPT